MTEALNDGLTELEDSQAEYGLCLAWEANEAFDLLKEAEAAVSMAIQLYNSETVEMYMGVEEKVAQKFNRFSEAAGLLIGRESGIGLDDLLLSEGIVHQKQPCFLSTINGCPEVCPGILASKFIEDGEGGEGFMVDVCPNPELLSKPDDTANYCGNGPDVIVMHRDTLPSDDEYAQAVRDFEW